MGASTLAVVEVKRFLRGRQRPVALALMILIPLLYGGLYLWAFWNPYGRLDRIPVALVNEDRPVLAGGQEVDLGAQIVQTLEHHRIFGWRLVDAAAARRGVQSGIYYASLTIPTAFSADVTSVSGVHPEPAVLEARINAASNYLVSQMAGPVFSAVRSAVATKLSTQYFAQILMRVSSAAKQAAQARAEVGSAASQLSSGASRADRGGELLLPGLVTAANGAGQLAGGTGALASGGGQLSAAASQLAAGAARLDAGLGLLQAQVSRLPGASSRLASGARMVASGTAQSSAGIGQAAGAADRLASGAASLHRLLLLYEASDPVAAVSPLYQQVLSAESQLATGLNQFAAALGHAVPGAQRLTAGAGAVSAGASALAAKMPALVAGLDAAGSGSAQLSAGSGRLGIGADGIAQGGNRAATGAWQLHSGLEQIVTGMTSLDNGLGRLAAGTATLSAKVHQSSSHAAPAGLGSTSSRSAVAGDPVRLASYYSHPVPNYGTGFAPYFLPLGLWVGCLMLYFLLRPLNRRAVAAGARPATVAAGGYLPVAGLAMLQAAIVLVVVVGLLGLHAAHPWALWLFTLFSAAVFAAVIQMLEAVLGSAGRIVALVMLILQLITSAGTYPIQTDPAALRAIQPLMPMTYMVNGLRDAVSGNVSYMIHDVAVLVVWLAVALALTTLAAARSRTLSWRILQPEIDMSVQ